MVSVFRGTLDFFDKLGVFDVVLPFLLVFTVVFAIFDKTRILGTEKIENVEYPKKNLNAIVAFAIAFFVVASSKLVELITTISSQVVILLILIVFFLLLIGTFFKEGEPVALEGKWRSWFMGIMLVGIIIIFTDALKRDSGESWLDFIVSYILNNFSSNLVASLILIGVIIFFIVYIIGGEKKPAAKKE